MSLDQSTLADQVGQLLQLLRQQQPRVHNITNYLAMNNSANALLALGAQPLMAHSREEASELCRVSKALVINISTLSTGWAEAMIDTAMTAKAHSIPWVLDPGGVDVSSYRMDTCEELAGIAPRVIRGNLREIAALCCDGKLSEAMFEDSEQLLQELISCAKKRSSILCITGEIDVITDGETTVRLSNGHQLSSHVAAMGCTASALIGAFLAVAEDAFIATVAATAVLGIAAELAAKEAKGPASFQNLLIDQLYQIEARQVLQHLRLA